MGKRGNGQGTARKRGKSWTAIWTLGTVVEDGRLRQIRQTKGGFKTKTEALSYAANPPTETSDRKVPTLQDYWEIWSSTSLPKLSKSKQTAYKIAKKKVERIMLLPVDKLSIKILQDAVDAKAPTYYPAKDIKAVLGQLYKRAVAEGWVTTNLADYIELPPLEEEELQPFNEKELRSFWDAYGKGDEFVGFILLMIYTGMMPGELMQMKKDMIDWDAREIRGCGLKTKKRKDTPIVFPEIIAPVLLDLCQRSKSRIGNVLCMNRDRFYPAFHDALARCGVRDLKPYSCRHTTATALALGNIAPSVIQEVMRHTKFSTTQRYIHPDMAAAHAAINSLDKGSSGDGD
ncbi:MAG: tyrosine-type recombinase/integrase [Dysosmobacter sp.]